MIIWLPTTRKLSILHCLSLKWISYYIIERAFPFRRQDGKTSLPGAMKTGLADICNFCQLPLSDSLFTVLFACVVFVFLLVFWLGICVPLLSRPPSIFFLFSSLPTILYLTQVTVIWNRCVPKEAGFGAVYF